MGEACCSIERMANGYEVEITDPDIVKANRNSGPNKPWRNPKVSYGFKTVDEVLAFLKKNLDKALPADEYGSSFELASQEDDD